MVSVNVTLLLPVPGVMAPVNPPPEAVQLVALVVVQLSVMDEPVAAEAALDLRLTVGAAYST